MYAHSSMTDEEEVRRDHAIVCVNNTHRARTNMRGLHTEEEACEKNILNNEGGGVEKL
jgi:hypothetical protein